MMSQFTDRDGSYLAIVLGMGGDGNIFTRSKAARALLPLIVPFLVDQDGDGGSLHVTLEVARPLAKGRALLVIVPWPIIVGEVGRPRLGCFAVFVGETEETEDYYSGSYTDCCKR